MLLEVFGIFKSDNWTPNWYSCSFVNLNSILPKKVMSYENKYYQFHTALMTTVSSSSHWKAPVHLHQFPVTHFIAMCHWTTMWIDSWYVVSPPMPYKAGKNFLSYCTLMLYQLMVNWGNFGSMRPCGTDISNCVGSLKVLNNVTLWAPNLSKYTLL